MPDGTGSVYLFYSGDKSKVSFSMCVISADRVSEIFGVILFSFRRETFVANTRALELMLLRSL